VHCIVGLGNPGPAFIGTRHNIGFRVVRAWAAQKNFGRFRRKFLGRFTQDRCVAVLLPQTFMNETGRSVAACLRFIHLLPEDLMVVHDDVDLPFGQIRFKQGGSSAGHKGLRSIESNLGSGGFFRLRFGIGRDSGIPTEEYVLQYFSQEEEHRLFQLLPLAGEGLDLWLEQGLESCMNRFNRKNMLEDESSEDPKALFPKDLVER
jgi:PTH1 family peptidyl-tRNA hydrolase